MTPNDVLGLETNKTYMTMLVFQTGVGGVEQMNVGGFTRQGGSNEP